MYGGFVGPNGRILKPQDLKGKELKAAKLNAEKRVINPFLPFHNPQTGRWAPPKYSLRRQAELIKKAKLTGTLDKLPPGPKFQHSTTLPTASEASKEDDYWTAPIEWVPEMHVKPDSAPGANIGARLYAGKKRMFKGHKWERVRSKKLAHRNDLMRNMRLRVRNFKKVCRRAK